MQHQIGFFKVLPGHALHFEVKSICYKFHSWLCNDLVGYSHKTLLNQTCADAPRTKALGKKNVLNLHACHSAIVSGAVALTTAAVAAQKCLALRLRDEKFTALSVVGGRRLMWCCTLSIRPYP